MSQETELIKYLEECIEEQKNGLKSEYIFRVVSESGISDFEKATMYGQVGIYAPLKYAPICFALLGFQMTNNENLMDRRFDKLLNVCEFMLNAEKELSDMEKLGYKFDDPDEDCCYYHDDELSKLRIVNGGCLPKNGDWDDHTFGNWCEASYSPAKDACIFNPQDLIDYKQFKTMYNHYNEKLKNMKPTNITF